MSDFFVHMGYGKTATTTLQNSLLGKHSQVASIGRPYPDEETRSMMFALSLQDSMFWKPEPIKRKVQQLRNDNPGKVLMVSEEALLGDSHEQDRGVICDRILDVFGPCKVIVTLRNQYDIIRSCYTGHGWRLKGVAKYSGRVIPFDNWFDHQLSIANDRSYFANKRYATVLDYLAGRFGRENMLVLLFEDFVRNRELWLNQFCSFVGIDMDEARSLLERSHDKKSKELKLYQIYGKTLRGLYWRTFHKEACAKVELESRHREIIYSMFAGENRRLVTEWGMELEQYGYPL